MAKRMASALRYWTMITIRFGELRPERQKMTMLGEKAVNRIG
jgi:hypothetical protein